MKTHEVKTHPDFFEASLSGAKPFEVRNNDREFNVHEILHQREWNPETEAYTGRESIKEITYVLTGERWGIKPGYAVLGLK